MRNHAPDLEKRFPFIKLQGKRKFLLAIYPQYHTQLLPDSILNNETFDIVQDVSHTNSIHKVYICRMAVEIATPGDVLIIYRTKDPKESAPAEYRSVATSVCVVEEVKRASEFNSEAEFIKYCGPYSVFPEDELKEWSWFSLCC